MVMVEKDSPPPPYGMNPGDTYPQPPPHYDTAQGFATAAPQPYPVGTYGTETTVITTTASPQNVFNPKFGEQAVGIKCPYCHEQIVTRTQYVNGALAWIICASLAFAGLFLIIPWFFCCVPFCLTACQDVEHSCPSCHRQLGSYRRLQ